MTKPTTACVTVRRKKHINYGTGIEQINCRFISAMFVCVLEKSTFAANNSKPTETIRVKFCRKANLKEKLGPHCPGSWFDQPSNMEPQEKTGKKAGKS